MAWIGDYFNLNKPVVLPGGPDESIKKATKTITRLKDAGKGEAETAPDVSIPWWQQVLMYLSIAVGVFFSDWVIRYGAGEQITAKPTLITIVMSLVIGAVVIPFAYDRLKVSADSPLMVRLGLFVQNGVFWPVIIDLVKKGLPD